MHACTKKEAIKELKWDQSAMRGPLQESNFICRFPNWSTIPMDGQTDRRTGMKPLKLPAGMRGRVARTQNQFPFHPIPDCFPRARSAFLSKRHQRQTDGTTFLLVPSPALCSGLGVDARLLSRMGTDEIFIRIFTGGRTKGGLQ